MYPSIYNKRTSMVCVYDGRGGGGGESSSSNSDCVEMRK